MAELRHKLRHKVWTSPLTVEAQRDRLRKLGQELLQALGESRQNTRIDATAWIEGWNRTDVLLANGAHARRNCIEAIETCLRRRLPSRTWAAKDGFIL